MAIMLKEKPVFVLGMHRSGTTMMMAMLGSHPRIAVPSEVSHYYQRFRPYIFTYGDLSNEENFRTLASEMVFGIVPPFFGMKVNPTTIVDEIVSEVKEQSFAGIFCAIFERYAREVGNKPRWGDKSPNSVFFIKQIKEDFPNAQFVYLTRDGRDNCAQMLQSPFGSNNIFCAAESWKLWENAAKSWRKKLSSSEWLDITYETLVREPEATLRKICEFIGEEYSTAMLEFYKSDIARSRAKSKTHQPIGGPVTDKYIGIYKEFLSLREQRIFAAVAGKEQEEAGYSMDVGPIEITEEEAALYQELDGRIRAAVMTSPGYLRDSYIEWLIDQREERKRRGIWNDADVPNEYPIGDPEEEHIMGKGAWKKWKDYFCIKRRYDR